VDRADGPSLGRFPGFMAGKPTLLLITSRCRGGIPGLSALLPWPAGCPVGLISGAAPGRGQCGRREGLAGLAVGEENPAFRLDQDAEELALAAARSAAGAGSAWRWA